MLNTLMTRYKFIKFKVNELYAELNIQSYPIDPFEIINHFSNIILIPYSRYMQDFNYSLEQMLKMTKSKLGCCQHQISYDRYMILYNDKCNCKGRILWTIIHELGHIMCNHYFLTFPATVTNKEIYDFKEREANFFASIFLAHPAILKKLDIQCSTDLEIYCSLSKEAASYRYKNFKSYDINHKGIYSDALVVDNFQKYLDDRYNDFLVHKKLMDAFKIAY